MATLCFSYEVRMCEILSGSTLDELFMQDTLMLKVVVNNSDQTFLVSLCI